MDFIISPTFRLLNHLNKVVHLKYGTGRVTLHNIHVYEFIESNRLSCDQVPDIDAAIVTIVGVIVEEDVVGLVVSLVDHQAFAHRRLKVVRLPPLIILGDDHARRLL